MKQTFQVCSFEIQILHWLNLQIKLPWEEMKIESHNKNWNHWLYTDPFLRTSNLSISADCFSLKRQRTEPKLILQTKKRRRKKQKKIVRAGRAETFVVFFIIYFFIKYVDL